MSLILDALVGALAKLADPLVGDGYRALKALILRKSGTVRERVQRKLDDLEQQPQDDVRKGVVLGALEDAGLETDAEVLTAADALVKLLNQGRAGDTTQVIQHSHGNNNIVAGTGNVNIAQGSGSTIKR